MDNRGFLDIHVWIYDGFSDQGEEGYIKLCISLASGSIAERGTKLKGSGKRLAEEEASCFS